MTTVDELRARGAWNWKVSVSWRGPDGQLNRRDVVARYCRDPETAIGFARRILRPYPLEITAVCRHEPTSALRNHSYWRQIRDLLIIAEAAWHAPRHPWERLLAGKGEPIFLGWKGHYRSRGDYSETWHFSCAGSARYYLEHTTPGYECPSCTAPLLHRSFPAGPYFHGNPETLCLLCGRWTKQHWVSYGHNTYEVRHRGQRVTWEDPEEKGKEVEKTTAPDPEWVPAAEWRPADRLEAASWRRLVARSLKAGSPREAWWSHRAA